MSGDDKADQERFKRLLQAAIAELREDSVSNRQRVYETTRDRMLAVQANKRALLEDVIADIESEYAPPQTQMDILLAPWRSRIRDFVKRYWLLVSDPKLFYERYVRHHTARDLRRALSHPLIVGTAITAVLAFLLPLLPMPRHFLPLIELFTKTSIFMAVFLLFYVPTFVVNMTVFKILRYPVGNLFFIYPSIATLGLLQLVAYLFAVAVFFPLSLAIGSSTGSINPIVYWAAFVVVIPLAVVIVTMLFSFYYIPVTLIEKIMGRSHFFAAMVFLFSAFALPLAFKAAGIDPFQPFLNRIEAAYQDRIPSDQGIGRND